MPKLKFLVVEDDLFYQTYVNDLLAETDVDILNASDGEAGLATAIAELPDLVITDIEIPKLQGFVLFKTLRENPKTKNIPVIMMSGKVEKELLDRHSGLSVHADGYLVKPFSGQVLVEMIRDIIGEDFGYSEVVISPEEMEGAHSQETGEKESIPEISQFPEEDPQASQKDLTLRALIVDDSRYICDIAKDFLEELDITVETAADGETGFQMACDILPDLVLLDVQMPNMNGFVVCEMLRKREDTKNIPIILMSAVVDDESFQRHSKLRYHADAYLQKPFMKSELHELVTRFCSPGKPVPGDMERKTGFFVPTEDATESEDAAAASALEADQKIVEELKQTKTELQVKVNREAQLENELENVKKDKDQIEVELFELRKAVEGKETGLQDKLTLATQRLEEARTQSEKLVEENRELKNQVEKLTPSEEANEKYDQLEKQLVKAHKKMDVQASEIEELKTRLNKADATVHELENRNTSLEAESAELREKLETGDGAAGVQDGREDLLKENEALQRDLAAAVEAKKEIEDQAKFLIESGDKSGESERLKQDLVKAREENKALKARVSDIEDKEKLLSELQLQLEKVKSETDKLRKEVDSLPDESSVELTDLKDNLSDALERVRTLEEEKSSLSDTLEDLEGLKDRNTELERLTKELKEEIEESRKLAASETQTRMDIEGKLNSQIEEKELLEGELGEARRKLGSFEDANRKVEDLEKMLEAEKELRDGAEEKIKILKGQLEELSAADEKLQQLDRDKRQLETDLMESRDRCDQLEKEASQYNEQNRKDTPDAKNDAAHWDERISKLEETLGKTVREAQTVLKDQKDRESALEENIESLMRSLDEERSAYRKERDSWSTREGELREAFDDALRESRRIMGEEAARLYPIHMPGRSRPLEVVSRTNRYGIIAAIAAAALVLLAGVYIATSRNGSTSSQYVSQIQSQPAAPGPDVSAGQPPEPWIARSGLENSYEELWRRNTVQSISDDMLIQATLHTRDELEAAINYTAGKEGWTRERIQSAMADMVKTYDLSGSFYITVYSKNLKSGYPGYADSFEQHIALRDHSGREVQAYFPEELEGSKFITNRISAAGKEMNPVFLYEVGLTVAFDRKGLAVRPEGLQLVLYDIGAVPMRVLTWDLSSMGSLLSYEPDIKKETAAS